MKRLVASHSQHFLHSPRLVAELIGHSNIRRADTVYDLGAGTGIISTQLARRCRQVVAVEVEPTALASLRRNTSNFTNITIVSRDIMQLDLPDAPYKIFANIPFDLSAPLVRRLTRANTPPRSIYLITQTQFARKLLADNRHFTSQLGAMIAPWWSVRIRRPLRRSDYTPPPAVDTCLVELKPRPDPLVTIDRVDYERFVERCFVDQKYFKAVRAHLSKLVEHDRTPSQLTAEQWCQLAKLT